MARLTPEDKILAGRKAVEAYRTAHAGLHSKGWHQGVSEEHIPLLNGLLVKLKEQGFNSLDEFFITSEELNIQELGFASTLGFNKKRVELTGVSLDEYLAGGVKNTAEAQELADKLQRMWH